MSGGGESGGTVSGGGESGGTVRGWEVWRYSEWGGGKSGEVGTI